MTINLTERTSFLDGRSSIQDAFKTFAIGCNISFQSLFFIGFTPALRNQAPTQSKTKIGIQLHNKVLFTIVYAS